MNINLLSNQEVHVTKKLQKLLDNYEEIVFNLGLVKVEGITTKLTLRPEATPRFHKSRPMPHALQPKVEETLKQMVRVYRQSGKVIREHQLYL